MSTKELTDEELDQPLRKLPDKPLEYTGPVITSILKAVRKKCLDCCCYQENEVKLCPATTCALFPFRSGRNPYNKKNSSDAQRAAAGNRLKKYWDDKKTQQDSNVE